MTRRRFAIPEPFRSRPFRVADALSAGVPSNVIDGPQFRRPFPGVRVPCHLPDTLEIRCLAAAQVLPESAAFSHETAAELCDLPLPTLTRRRNAREAGEQADTQSEPVPAPEPLQVIVEPDVVVPQIAGIRGHTGFDAADLLKHKDLRIVHPVRTYFHLATTLTHDDLVVLGDAIVRHWSDRETLIGRAAGLSGRRGIVKGKDALALVQAGVDSPPESRVRLHLIRAGLPCPKVNIDVFDFRGRWIARPDLSYPDLKIAIEYDGDHHRTDKHQWRRDRARDADLRDAGWIVVTLTADDLFRRPDQFVNRVIKHYRERARTHSR